MDKFTYKSPEKRQYENIELRINSMLENVLNDSSSEDEYEKTLKDKNLNDNKTHQSFPDFNIFNNCNSNKFTYFLFGDNKENSNINKNVNNKNERNEKENNFDIFFNKLRNNKKEECTSNNHKRVIKFL